MSIDEARRTSFDHYADIADVIDRHGGSLEMPHVTLAFLAFARAGA